MSNSVPAVLTGLPKQQRITYVSWPAPPAIRKHRDFWTHGDQEISGWSTDLLFFKLTHVVSTENKFDKAKPDRVAHYQQITKPEYEALVQSQAAMEHKRQPVKTSQMPCPRLRELLVADHNGRIMSRL
jgi:hypothetical protein